MVLTVMALSLPAPWYKNILQCRQLLVLCGERAWEEQGLHWVVRWQNMICDYAVQLITDSLSFPLLVIILVIIAVEFYFPGSTLGAEQTAMIFNFARRAELRPFVVIVNIDIKNNLNNDHHTHYHHQNHHHHPKQHHCHCWHQHQWQPTAGPL